MAGQRHCNCRGCKRIINKGGTTSRRQWQASLCKHHSQKQVQAIRAKAKKMWAEKVGRGFAFHGIARGAPKWERLDKAWVETNFSAYPAFLDSLRTNGGQPLVVPKGRAAGIVPLVGGVAESHWGVGGSGLTGALVPSVPFQDERP